MMDPATSSPSGTVLRNRHRPALVAAILIPTCLLIFWPSLALAQDATNTLDDDSTSRMQALLQNRVGFLIGGAIFLVIGVLALLLTAVRREARNGLVLPFALMSLIWGVRFISYPPVIPFALDVDPETWLHIRRPFTFLITPPAFLLALRIYGAGWGRSLLVMTWINTAFAVFAVVTILTRTAPDNLIHGFNVMVLLSFVVMVGNMVRPENIRRRDVRVLIIGTFISVFFITLENLGSLGIIRITSNMEWIGVAILYCTLFYVTFNHFFGVSQNLSNLRQELETARRIQTSILPHRTPEPPGLDIVTRYLPMTEVAGDFYDFSRIDDDRIGCLIADVSGHGVPAALVASMVKVAFQAQTGHGQGPATVLSGMNEMLGHRLEGQFVTAGYACFDLAHRTLRYACAGHPPVLIRPGGGGDIETIPARGLILGPFPDASYESLERPLAEGDRILMYTDGIVEAVDGQDEEFGEDRVAELLRTSQDLSAERFADTLLEAVHAWTGAGGDSARDDDLTLVVIDVAC